MDETPHGVTGVEVDGPHPAGLVGTHIHRLMPVGAGRMVWYIDYQDVIAVGLLLEGGRLPVERVVAVGGPNARRPRLLRTRLGADLDDLLAGEMKSAAAAAISGPALCGRIACGPTAFLGRYHAQVSLLDEALLDTRAPSERFPPFIPIDAFERVLPLDLLPGPLFRALLAGDLESAEALGCLELEEEDVALCAYVCPSGIDYGGLLRATLDRLQETQ
jgi:Na+-transporting NADH:ubiquinone oxidoreductase subunit A